MNTIKKYTGRSLWLAGLMMTTLMAGCLGGGGSSSDPTSDENGLAASEVASTNPADGAIDVALNRNVIAIFDEELEATSVTDETFTLSLNGTAVAGTVTYNEKTATFTPTNNLDAGQEYTATLTTGIIDLTGKPLSADYVWSFTTGATVAAGPGPVNLGAAGNYVILAKTAISSTPSSTITGDIGLSPETAAAITVACAEMVGTSKMYSTTADARLCYQADAPGLTTAVEDMLTAYNDAAGRTLPDFTEEHTGLIGGETLVPGLYKWGTSVSIAAGTNVTLSGAANDVWIFQIAGDLTQASNTQVILAGGALAKNIFWQVGGGAGVTIGTDAVFHGVVLAEKAITLTTRASATGRLLAQSAVTLDQNPVTQPAE